MCLASVNPCSDCSVSQEGQTPGYIHFLSRAVNRSMTGSTWRASYLLSWLGKDLYSHMHLVAQRHQEPSFSRELHELMHHCSICIARGHKLVQLAKFRHISYTVIPLCQNIYWTPESQHHLHLIPSSKERLGSLPWALWVRILHSAFKSNKQWDISLNNWSATGIFSDIGCLDCSTSRICSFREAFSSISLWFFVKSKWKKGES